MHLQIQIKWQISSQEGAFGLIKGRHFRVEGRICLICVDVFRRVGQIFALLMHPEAAHGADQPLECHWVPIPSCHIVCECMHACDSCSAEILDACFWQKGKERRSETKIRPRPLQIAKISPSGLMQTLSPVSAGILNGLLCRGSGIQMQSLFFPSLHNCERNPRERLARTS